jgi:hypothetical protein
LVVVAPSVVPFRGQGRKREGRTWMWKKERKKSSK